MISCNSREDGTGEEEVLVIKKKVIQHAQSVPIV